MPTKDYYKHDTTKPKRTDQQYIWDDKHGTSKYTFEYDTTCNDKHGTLEYIFEYDTTCDTHAHTPACIMHRIACMCVSLLHHAYYMNDGVCMHHASHAWKLVPGPPSNAYYMHDGVCMHACMNDIKCSHGFNLTIHILASSCM